MKKLSVKPKFKLTTRAKLSVFLEHLVRISKLRKAKKMFGSKINRFGFLRSAIKLKTVSYNCAIIDPPVLKLEGIYYCHLNECFSFC